MIAASLGVGYVLGASSSHSHASKPSSEPSKQAKPLVEEANDEDSGWEDEEDDAADGDLSNVKPRLFEECKLVRPSHPAVIF